MTRSTTGASDGRRGSADRGQIALDFAIGASLFLLALTFAAIFIPTLITPFISGGAQANDIAAERIASNLAWQLQADASGETALDKDCVDKFFKGSGSYSNCHASGSRFDILTNSSTTFVSVRLLNAEDGTVYNSIGPDMSSISGSGYASRPVRLDTGSGVERTLVVEVY